MTIRKLCALASSLVIVALAVVAICAPSVSALFEHEVGTKDWHREHVGDIDRVLFLGKGGGGDDNALIVSTKRSHMLASLRREDGHIVWRRPFHRRETIHNVETIAPSTGGSYIVTVSGEGCAHVKFWTTKEGWLVGQHYSSPVSSAQHLTEMATKSEKCDVKVSDNGQKIFVIRNHGRAVDAYALHPEMQPAVGKRSSSPFSTLQWTLRSDDSNVLYHSFLSGSEESTVKVFGIEYENVDNAKRILIKAANIVEIDAESGNTLQSNNMKRHAMQSTITVNSVEDDIALLRGANGSDDDDDDDDNAVVVVIMDRTAQMLYAIDIIGNKQHLQSFKQLHLSTKISDASILKMTSVGGRRSRIHIYDSEKNTVSEIAIDSNGIAHKMTSKGSIVVTSQKHDVSLAVQKDKNRLAIGNVFANHSVDEHGLVRKVFVAPGDSEEIILVSQDDSMIMIKEGKAMWIREEALASVTQSNFVELPFKSLESGSELLKHPLWRLRLQFKQLTNYFTDIADFVCGSSNGMKRKMLSQSELMSQDPFNFRKLIIVMTRSGKIFALHTTTGEIMWSRFIGTLMPQDVHVSPSSLELHIVRRQFRADVVVEPELAVLARHKKGTVAININAMDGKIVSVKQLPLKFVDAFVLPESEESSQLHPILLTDEKQRVHVLPEGNEKIDEFVRNHHPQRVHFSAFNITSNSVKGYALHPGNEQPLQTTEMWSHIFPNPITATGKQLASMANIFSSIQVSEDSATVMHKYLNPHALIVATMHPMQGKKPQDLLAQRLDIYVIDGITGDIVYHTFQNYVTGPVNVALDENVLIYQFSNIATKRYEVAVVELLVDKPMGSLLRTILRLGTGASRRPLSAYELPKPFAKRQSFVFPSGVVALTTTKTHHGIISKLFLFGLATNQVLAVNKRLLDVHRPEGAPTPEEQEKGLLQYSPYLPYDPHNIISYNHTVQGVRGIETSPSHLESTTHVFVHGVDLFYSLVAPTKPFDVLNEDFSYLLLIITFVVTTVLAVFVRKVANKREIKRQWA